MQHEPIPVETWAHKEGAGDVAAASRYIEKFRMKEIYLRASGRPSPVAVYGEVNGALRRHIEPISRYIPGVILIHLVRDGRDVVRSVVSRGTYAGNHPVYSDFRPPLVDEYSQRWEMLSEFEKACWVWQWENEYMRSHTEMRVRIEDILASFQCLQEQILTPLGLELDESVWQAAVQRPQNVSQEHTIGSWEQWSDKRKTQFLRICGAEMGKCGYEIGEISAK